MKGSLGFLFIFMKLENKESFVKVNTIDMGREDSFGYSGPLNKLVATESRSLPQPSLYLRDVGRCYLYCTYSKSN